MNRFTRWRSAVLLCLILLFLPQFVLPCLATEPTETVPKTEISETAKTSGPRNAVDISHRDLITEFTGFRSVDFLFDKKHAKTTPYLTKCTMTMENVEGIASVYLVFLSDYGTYSITDNATGAEYVVEDALLHDFVDVEAAFGKTPSSITLTFPAGNLTLSEVYAFTSGQVPDFVQKWKLPEDGNADIVLFAAHSYDEHLFFAGILPYYAKELGYQVQVVYFVDHRNTTAVTRQQEALDGLWAVGVDTYPVFSTFQDFRIDSKETTYRKFLQYGHTQEDLVAYVVENIRRFKPKVVIGHDFAGEYGHGQHQVYAEALATAVGLSMDKKQFPESAKTYGVWDVPKTYFHLYKENPIVMDWDQPLKSFDGMTAFEVSIQRGFQANKSQVPFFAWCYAGAHKAAEVQHYNPCHFGLFRTTVGEDVKKNDFFENLTTHAEEAIEEAKRKAEEEAARLAAEQEAQRKLEEETAAREAARLALEEAAAKEAAKDTATKKRMMTILWVVSIGLVVMAIPLAKVSSKKS